MTKLFDSSTHFAWWQDRNCCYCIHAMMDAEAGADEMPCKVEAACELSALLNVTEIEEGVPGATDALIDAGWEPGRTMPDRCGLFESKRRAKACG